jgi:hypothetical protein
MDITGKIHEIFPIQTIKSSFTKREFILLDDTNDQFPQYIKFELIQDKCSIIDDYKPGDTIKVYFNLKGREWINPKGEKVYFNSLGAWKIESAGSGSQPEMTPPDFMPGDDDMPF